MRVHIDDHGEVDGPDSSVPYALVPSQREARLSAQTVARGHQGKRRASHRRSWPTGRHSPGAVHLPTAPRPDAEWTPQRLMRWATKPGAATAQGSDTMLASRRPPPQGVRSGWGIRRLGTSDGAQRLDAACQCAIPRGAWASTRLAALLQHALERQP